MENQLKTAQPCVDQTAPCPGCQAGLPLQSSPGGYQAFHHNYEAPVLECTAFTGTDTNQPVRHYTIGQLILLARPLGDIPGTMCEICLYWLRRYEPIEDEL